MPKKFKGVNTKADAARERKASARAEEDARRHQAAEDEFWRDDDKQVAKKQQRKVERESKRVDQLERKKAVQAALEEEEAGLKKSSSAKPSKVTQAQIRQSQTSGTSAAAAGVEPCKSRVVVPSEVMEENPNRLVAEDLATGGGVEARSVGEAIAVLSIKEPDLERHPERRVKAAYATFEERRFAELKAENPSLRQSQVRQMLRKEWQRSPENPMNQVHSSYNARK